MSFSKLYGTFLLLITCSYVIAQVSVEETELYRDDVLPRIDILLPADSLAWLYESDNLDKNDPLHATFVFDNGNVHDTLFNVGFRLRGNTSRNAAKKSFKVDLNAFVQGQKYYEVEKLNLNGQQNDPTISRAKFCSFLSEELGLISLRTNHVKLYINGNYHGLYTNVEHIDEEFVRKRFDSPAGNLYKCLYPADLNYKGDNPEVYKELVFGRRAYDLKTNVLADNYSDLAKFIDVLNNVDIEDLPCELEDIFHVDSYLKFIVFDILTGNWDGPIYNKNNFYLYYDPIERRFEYIPYDLDNTLGIDWLNRDWGNRNMYSWSQTGESRPIYSRILEVQEYRDRFSYYMQDALLSIYKSEDFEMMVDDIVLMIKDAVEEDTFYPQDFGFSIEDFVDGFSQPLPYFQTDYGILDFIETRREACLNQVDTGVDIAPVVSDIHHNYPVVGEMLFVQAKAFDDNQLVSFEVCLEQPNGNVLCQDMWDDGAHGDGATGDGVYGNSGFQIDVRGGYSIFLEAKDDQEQLQQFPSCGGLSIYLNDEIVDLKINEFMARNSMSHYDQANEADDWIELLNIGSNVVNIAGCYLTDNPDMPFKFPLQENIIVPGSYRVLWADDDLEQGLDHGPFKLSGNEGYVGLYRKRDSGEPVLIDEVNYGSQQNDVSMARIPNGNGPFIAAEPTPGAFNEALFIDDYSSVELNWSVYPNPSSGEIHLLIDQYHPSTAIKIYNTLGQLVLSSQAVEGRPMIVSLEDDGVYYMILEIDNLVVDTRKHAVAN